MLSQYLDAELPESTCKEIRQHIHGCPPCVQFVESLKRSIDLCHEYSSGEVPRPIREEARQELLGAYRKMLSAREGASGL